VIGFMGGYRRIPVIKAHEYHFSALRLDSALGSGAGTACPAKQVTYQEYLFTAHAAKQRLFDVGLYYNLGFTCRTHKYVIQISLISLIPLFLPWKTPVIQSRVK
jgi:hypothetical protein